MIAVPCGASYLFGVTSRHSLAPCGKKKNVVREMLELHVFKRSFALQEDDALRRAKVLFNCFRLVVYWLVGNNGEAKHADHYGLLQVI